MGIAIYVLTFAVLLVGLYAVVAKKNIIKIILGLLILDYGVNMLLVLVGYRNVTNAQPPILSPGQPVTGQAGTDFVSTAVDPLPQAMVLTSIVIGLGITALMVAMAIRLYEKYGTFDMYKIRKLKG